MMMSMQRICKEDGVNRMIGKKLPGVILTMFMLTMLSACAASSGTMGQQERSQGSASRPGDGEKPIKADRRALFGQK